MKGFVLVEPAPPMGKAGSVGGALAKLEPRMYKQLVEILASWICSGQGRCSTGASTN